MLVPNLRFSKVGKNKEMKYICRLLCTTMRLSSFYEQVREKAAVASKMNVCCEIFTRE